MNEQKVNIDNPIMVNAIDFQVMVSYLNRTVDGQRIAQTIISVPLSQAQINAINSVNPPNLEEEKEEEKETTKKK